MSNRVVEFVKEHPVAIGVGVIGIIIIMRYSGGSAPASGADGSAAALQAAFAANGQYSLASQQVANQAAAQAAQTSAASKAASESNQVALTQAIGQNITAIGSTIAATVAAQSALPAAAIAAASANNQQALVGSAAVAAQGVASYADVLNAGAHAIGVQTGNFGTTLMGLTDSLASMGGSALNAIAATVSSSAASASASAGYAAAANSGTAQQLIKTGGEVAKFAMLA